MTLALKQSELTEDTATNLQSSDSWTEMPTTNAWEKKAFFSLKKKKSKQ